MWFSLRIYAALTTVVGLLFFWPNFKELPQLYPNTIGLLPDWIFDDWRNSTILILLAATLHAEYVNLRKHWSFRWLSVQDGSRYLRQRMHEDGSIGAGSFMDAIHEETASESFEDTAMSWLVDGVNDGIVQMRGTVRNTVSPKNVPIPLKDHWSSSIQNRNQSEAQIGADGLIYEHLRLSKAGIKAYSKVLARSSRIKTKEARQKR